MKLKVGDKAPFFEAIDSNGKTHNLSDYKGKKIVLYFYPKDNTPGCTAQACDLRDNYEALLKNNFIVFGVSADSLKSHNNFINKHELPFPLLVDENKQIIEKYDVWQEKKMYGKTYMGIARTTFVIDENGIISEIIEKVNTKNHTTQILK